MIVADVVAVASFRVSGAQHRGGLLRALARRGTAERALARRPGRRGRTAARARTPDGRPFLTVATSTAAI